MSRYPGLLTNWLQIRGSHDTLFGFSNLPEDLTVLDYQFIVKCTTREQEAEEMQRARDGKGHGASMLPSGAPLSQDLHVFTNRILLRGFWGGGIGV